MKQNHKKTLLLSALAVLIAALIVLGIYLKSVSDYKRAVREITIQSIDVTKIPDGVYTGKCDVKFVSAKVEVTVQSGKITSITILEHKNDRGQPAEVVTQRIVEEQKIDIDAVAGATNSSTVLKKAVENALTQ